MIPTIMIPVKEADILFNSTFKKKPKTSPYSMAPSSPLTPIRVSRLMSFKKFLKILSILAKKVYPSLKDPKQAFENLFNEKFFQNIVLQNERIANELKSSGFKSKLGQSEGNSRLSKTKNNESDFDKEMRHTRVATEKIEIKWHYCKTYSGKLSRIIAIKSTRYPLPFFILTFSNP